MLLPFLPDTPLLPAAEAHSLPERADPDGSLLVLGPLEEVEAVEVAVGEAGDEGAEDVGVWVGGLFGVGGVFCLCCFCGGGGGGVGGDDGGVVGAADAVSAVAVQDGRFDLQHGFLPGLRVGAAVADAMEDLGGHEGACFCLFVW